MHLSEIKDQVTDIEGEIGTMLLGNERQDTGVSYLLLYVLYGRYICKLVFSRSGISNIIHIWLNSYMLTH